MRRPNLRGAPKVTDFSSSILRRVTGLAGSAAPMLEDAWLLESGWLMRHTRDGLRHLWDDHYLGRSPLAEWALVSAEVSPDPVPPNRGE